MATPTIWSRILESGLQNGVDVLDRPWWNGAADDDGVKAIGLTPTP